MKDIIFTFYLLTFNVNLWATQLTYVGEDGIKVYGRDSVELTKKDEGHCRQDINPYAPNYASDFCDKSHIEQYGKIIETDKINFSEKYILAFLPQSPKDIVSIDSKIGKTVVKLAGSAQRDVVAIDPKKKSVFTLSLGVSGKVTFSKGSQNLLINGSIHGYRMDSDGEFIYNFDGNSFNSGQHYDLLD